MGRDVRFTATDEEYAEIQAYVAAKKRWHKIPHFVRDAVFQAIQRNPVGSHRNGSGVDATRSTNGTAGAGSE